MAEYLPLPGSERTLLPDSRPAGTIDPSELASITVRVRPRDGAEDLEQHVLGEATKPVSERQYLTRQELAEQNGASETDLDMIEQYARRHDLEVVHRSAAERSIVLRGKLGDLLSAFHADLHICHHATGTYRGRQGEIKIPQELGDIITGIFGFDTRQRRRSSRRRQYASSDGPGGLNGVSASDFAKRYKFPTSFNGSALDGTGQTVAIVELGGGYRTADLQAYFHEIDTPIPKVVAVSVDHASNAPSTPDSADGEVMLDLEVIGAVAPNATIVVYFAPNNGDKGFIDAISAAVHDSARNPSVVSISWGGIEDITDQQGIAAFHSLFVEAAALGVTICAAAGDHGVADEDAQNWDGTIHVDHPAVDDFVLSCGGTQIAQGKDVVWNDGTPFDRRVPGGGGWATGGGISTVFTQVPNYQQGIVSQKSLDTGQPGRGVLDIAMSATPTTSCASTAGKGPQVALVQSPRSQRPSWSC
jgi:kumamolisin